MANLQYLSLPAAATGLAPASGGTAWTYGSYVEATSSTSTGIYITGIQIEVETNPAAADATNEILIEVATGAGGAEVTKLQVPLDYRADTITSANNGLGYWMPRILTQFFPEPYFVPLGTRVAVRATDQKAGAVTYRVKLLYREGDVPTVSLNTPADTATITDTTPTLNFTGTDADSDAVEYEVQVGTSTFADITVGNSISGGSGSVSSDSFAFDSGSTGSNRILIMGFSNFDTTSGDRQVSTVTYGGQALTKVATAVSDNTTSNGRAELWYIVNPLTGSNTVAFTFGGTITNSDRFVAVFNNVDQSNPINDSDNGTTTAGTQQRITLTTTNIGEMLVDVNNGDAGGQTLGAGQTSLMDLSGSTARASYKLATATGNYNMDMNTAGSDNYAHAAISLKPSNLITIDALSASDAGFTAGHPFASAAAIDYTVQSALADTTTYYWRVRAIDPTGTNTWGSWSTTWSFTTTAGGGGTVYQVTRMMMGMGM